MCELERVVIEPDERIVFTRTIRKVPPLYSESALRALTVGRTFHEPGPISNICADWASAADALAAVKEFVYDKESVEPMRLLRALEDNFANNEELRLRLRERAPKVGNNDDRADQWLVTLFEMFAEACRAAGENGRGGRYRLGSGSAMYYVWLATGHEGMQEPVVGATADGRKSGEFFSSSLAPSPDVLVQGP